MKTIRKYGFVIAAVLVGVYLTIPALVFDFGRAVLVLERADIDRVIAITEALPPFPSPTEMTEESLRPFAAARVEVHEVESRGRRSYRLRSQHLFYDLYQEPSLLRSLYAWVESARGVFRTGQDEYLGWLWFTVVCVSTAYVVQLRVCHRWKLNASVVSVSRWLFFCGCAMAASMILAAVLECDVRAPWVSVASRLLSGPAYVFGGYVYSPPMIVWEAIILLSAIQWVLVGALGTLLIKRLKGRRLSWVIACSLAACGALGLITIAVNGL